MLIRVQRGLEERWIKVREVLLDLIDKLPVLRQEGRILGVRLRVPGSRRVSAETQGELKRAMEKECTAGADDGEVGARQSRIHDLHDEWH